MSNATFCEVWNFRFFKPNLSIQHISWRGKQTQYHFSHPWLQTCHTPATCHSRSTRTVQTGRQQSYVTHFRSSVSGAVMDVSVGLFAECIDSRAQSGPIPWFMSTPLLKNLNPSFAVCWNSRANANQMANHLLIVTSMQLSLMKSFMMPFTSESTTKMNTQEGRGQEKEMWPE